MEPSPPLSPLQQRYVDWLGTVQTAHRRFVPISPDNPTRTEEFVDKDLLWKQYQLHIDLYKHYLDLVVKFNVFYYAITGAFLSYYFSHLASPFVKWSLIFPIAMSVFFAWVFYKGARVVNYVDDEVMFICTTFGFTQPEVYMLTYTLIATGSLFVVIGLALLVGLVLILRGF